MKAPKLRDPSMEDLNSAVVAAMTYLQLRNVIDTSDPMHDRLFDELIAVLEKNFNYPDYESHN